MAVAEAAVARAKANAAPYLVALLAMALFINYVDRGNLATASPLIKDELRLSNTQMGLMISAFFWTYAPAQLLSGWLADRINPYRALALGFALWSAATALTGVVSGFAALIALRIVLGFGESAAFPCSSKLVAQHLPPDKLGVANGVIGAGLSFGPAFGTLAGGYVMAQFGWRAMFVLFGLTAFLWLVPWLSVTRAAALPAHAPEFVPAPHFRAIIAQRAIWGSTLGHFAANYGLYFVLSWLPLYLVKDRGFSIIEMARLGASVYAVSGVAAMVAGWLTDRWIASGASLTRVRKTTVVIGHFGTALCLVVCALGGQTATIASLLVCGIFLGMNTSAIWSITQTLAGPRAAARWVGVQNSIGNIAGIAAPIVTGFAVDRTGYFVSAFLIAAAVVAIGAAGWALIIRRVEPVRWDANQAVNP
jgi:MFS family permease